MTSHKGGTNNTKDVIYIDVDDEITSIIDKVRDSEKKIVALVLPKRATVLQSIVNMKLLKRAASDSKKNLVLITSETGLLPLAGSIGVHVAKSLSSKPEVPDAPPSAASKAEAIDDSVEVDDVDVDPSRTVGELSGGSPVDDEDETIELDDETEGEEVTEGGKVKKFKNKKFRIPNFNKFRVMLALAGVAVILLAVLGYAAVAVWPSAKVTIQTDSTAVNSNLTLNLRLDENTDLDVEKAVLKAAPQEVEKTLTQEVAATGQKNNGKKATGIIKIINCTAGDPLTIPAGTRVSSAGQSFKTDTSINIPVGSASCSDFEDVTSKTVGITAVSAGTKSNVAAGTFTVSGYSGRTLASSSSATTGGTDEVIKVVSKEDVEGAEQKIAELDDQAVRQELAAALIEGGFYAVESTFTAGEPKTELSVEVNEPADSVTVTQTIKYTMLGVKLEDLQKIIENDVKDNIDLQKQSVTNYGLDEATFTLQGSDKKGAVVGLQTTVVAGAELNIEAIKQQVAGKKAGEAKELIKANPGVKEVEVEYSPFWVGSIPKKTSKITVIIQEPEVASDDKQSSP